MKTYFPGNLGGNDRRFTRTPSTYDSGSTDKRSGMYRRGNYHRKRGPQDTHPANITENMSAIKEFLNDIRDLQKRIATAQERHADAAERIVEYLGRLVGSPPESRAADGIGDLPAVEPEPVMDAEPAEQSADTAEVFEDPVSSSETEGAVEIITRMREAGTTFDKIAEHLESERIPPAGDGKWSRWTVSKLYRESVQQ